jgi:DNA-binding Lrp family transcriptional regulator
MKAARLDQTDRKVLNALQHGMPVCPRPYAAAAVALGLSEKALIARLKSLLERKVLSRFGPLYDAEKLGGAVTLAALAVPEARFEELSELVNGFPEVAHNYARDHALNMWFVVATERPERIDEVLAEIERRSGLTPINLPKEEEYFLELKLEV